MRIFRIAALVLGMLLMAGQADAQVSVRRGSRSATDQPRTGRDNKPKKDPKAATTSSPTLGKGDAAAAGNVKAGKENGRPLTAPSDAKPADVKPATPATPRKNATSSPQRRQPAAPAAGGKTLRQQAFDAYQKEAAEETPWQHVVYREIDLTDEKNASLYFPIEPIDGLTNLFRVIVDAFAKGELKAYEYLDGREVFTDKYQVKVEDVLDKFQIYYQKKPATQRGGADVYEIDESDVPCSELLSYYIKERWEFDQKHSKYQARVLCICPVLHRAGDFGGTAVKYPMFWINYEDLRPFLRDHLVVSSGMNTAARYTMEEFFSLGQYNGTIYKEQNLRGLSLMQQYPDADTLKMVQQRLDEELRAFKDSIWVQDEPVEAVEDKKSHKKTAPAADKTADTDGDATKATDKAAAATDKKNRRTKEAVDADALAEKEANATKKHSARRSR
ncbi:MAG: gliding motility protein GldN [Bacteroidales bacterium]|nr:gliding motility protein GldN [Candidatus Liminaster caballi]